MEPNQNLIFAETKQPADSPLIVAVNIVEKEDQALGGRQLRNCLLNMDLLYVAINAVPSRRSRHA